MSNLGFESSVSIFPQICFILFKIIISLVNKVKKESIPVFIHCFNSKFMAQKKNRKSLLIASSNHRIFWIVLLLIPIIFFIVLEFGLRIFDYGDDLSLFKEAKGEYSEYMYINRWVAKRYFTNTNIVPDPPNDVFLKDKPDNGFRIFVLGGSTAAGWPYSNNLMFSRILQKRLADAYPEKYIEVVNTSISSINSYALLDFSRDILDYEPDLILIYTGHNEYYGSLGVVSTQNISNQRWLKKLYLNSVQYKTFQLHKNTIQYFNSLFITDTQTLDDQSTILMQKLVGSREIELNSDLYQEGKEQFEANFKDIVEEFNDSEIHVILSEIVSNLEDQPPFKSLEKSKDKSANNIFGEAKKLNNSGNYAEAREMFKIAKDLDALRFRASEDFNEITHDIGQQFSLPVVNTSSYFEAQAGNGIIGNDLMIDHLHPNVDGSFILADGFLNVIASNQFITGVTELQNHKSSSEYRKEWGYSRLDSVYAEMKIKYLKSGWPFKKKKSRSSSFNFSLKNIIDETALRIWKDRKYTSEDGHADLANYYESKGLFLDAFQEYNALTCLKPLNNSAYLKAADVSIKSGNMEQALPFLLHSLKLEKTAFAYKWIGLINLELENLEIGIENLEIVYKLDVKDPEILYNLSLAYFQNNKYQQAEVMLKDLEGLKRLILRLKV